MTAPVANRGILPQLTVPTFGCQPVPPNPGTQSGTVKPILLIPPITQFNPLSTALIIPLTKSITALIGVFANPKKPPKIVTIPLQALLQFPVNTPVKKSIKPLKIFFIPPKNCDTPLKKSLMTCPAEPKTVVQSVRNNDFNHRHYSKRCRSTNHCYNCLQR